MLPVLLLVKIRPLLARCARLFALSLHVLLYNEVPEHWAVSILGIIISLAAPLPRVHRRRATNGRKLEYWADTLHMYSFDPNEFIAKISNSIEVTLRDK